jgi:hypothetical protein
MKVYSKIDTLLERDERFQVTTELRRPVFGHITTWVVTEKVDGTNIRLGWERRKIDNVPKVSGAAIGGKTDNAQIPVKLYDVLIPITDRITLEVAKIMEEFDLEHYTLYGEGYGAGIQKGGNYRDDLGFVLFDILVNEMAWLDDSQVTDTANRLGLERAPILGYWSLEEIATNVKESIPSIVALSHGKTHQAEGIVARPVEPLYDRRAERLILKLKTKDFRAGKR